MAEIHALRKRIWGWIAFDWAAQPFYTLGLTFIFGPYFAGVVAARYRGEGLDEQSADAWAQMIWAMGTAVSGIVIAVMAVTLGAYADCTGRRMRWMVLSSVAYVIFALTMWYMTPDGSAMWFCLFGFFMTMIAAEVAMTFNNAVLPSLGAAKDIGRISGTGNAIGYWGGLVALIIMLLFFFELNGDKTILGFSPPFGLNGAEREGTRFVGPFTSLWFIIFVIPYFLYVREQAAPKRRGGFRLTMAELRENIAKAVKRRSLFSFIIAAMLYQDALNALYSMGGVYARLVLDWSLAEIAAFGIIGITAAAVATYIGGLADQRFGPKPVIKFCICVLIAVSCIIISINQTMVFWVEIPQGSNLPDIIFYICGASIGGAGGALYSASRSMMARHTDPARPVESFGLFSLSGKATAFAAPALILLFTYVFQNAQLGYIPLILLFICSLFVLRGVMAEGDLK